MSFTSTLPPVRAPAEPQPRQCFEVGPRLFAERYRVNAVTGKSFTVSHSGKRERHDRATWHAWLQRLCTLGTVHLEGHPMLPPGPAPLWAGLPVGAPEQETDMDSNDRHVRLQRALGEVRAYYRIVPEAPVSGCLFFSLHGGGEVWRVEVDRSGQCHAACDCPDFTRRGLGTGEVFACKHILAVLLSQPELRFQALDYFL